MQKHGNDRRYQKSTKKFKGLTDKKTTRNTQNSGMREDEEMRPCVDRIHNYDALRMT